MRIVIEFHASMPTGPTKARIFEALRDVSADVARALHSIFDRKKEQGLHLFEIIKISVED